MRPICANRSLRPALVAIVGTTAVVSGLLAAPAQAAEPSPTPDATYSGTLVLCIGEQPGATNTLYAEGTSYVPPSTGTVPPGFSADCHSFPVQPGTYYITGYKYPQAPCPPTDVTRGTPPNPGQCIAKIHHIHVGHLSGVITTINGTNSAPTEANFVGSPYNQAPANSEFYVRPTTGVGGSTGTTDTTVEEDHATVVVRANETVFASAHTTDHETPECYGETSTKSCR